MLPYDWDSVYKLTQEQYKSAFEIFKERMFPQEQQLMCSFYAIFSEPGGPSHNCLGCNLNESLEKNLNFLGMCKNMPNDEGIGFSPQQSFSIYIWLLNEVWERILTILDLVDPRFCESVRRGENGFQAFIKTRKWANFFKHPKSFGWKVHHPEYTFEGSAHSMMFLNSARDLQTSYNPRIIDDAFVKRYYSNNERDDELAEKFDGYEAQTLVILPDIPSLTTQICDCLEEFIEIIVGNENYVAILRDKSTLTNYFSSYENLEAG